MSMVQEKQPCCGDKSSEAHEIVAEEVGYRALIRSLMQYKCAHCPKVNPVPTLIRGSDRRWKLVAPCFLNMQIAQKYSGTEALLDMDDSLPVSLPVFIIPANQEMEQMVHPIKMDSHTDSSFGSKITRRSHNRSKRSKSLKDCSNISSDTCVMPYESPEFLCNDLSLSTDKSLCDGESKIKQTMKECPKKKGKKKSGRRKKPHPGKNHIANEVVCERTFQNISSFEISGESEQSMSFTDLSGSYSPESIIKSGFATQLTRKVTNVKGNNDDLLGCLCPEAVYVSNSDLMDESGHSSISNEIQTEKLALSSIDKSAANADSSKTSSTSDTLYYSSLDKSPLSDSFLDEWPSDVARRLRCINDENMSDFLHEKRFLSVECQTVVDSLSKSCTLESTIFAQCDRNVDAMDAGVNSRVCLQTNFNDIVNAFDESSCLDDNESCESGCICQSCNSRKRVGQARELPGNSISLHKIGCRKTHTKTRKDVAAPVWQKVEKKGTDGCIQRPQMPKPTSESDALKELEARTRNDALLSSWLNEKELLRGNHNCDEITSYPDACVTDNKVFELNRLNCDSNFQKVVHVSKKLKNPCSMLKENTIESCRKGPDKGKPITLQLPKIPKQEQSTVNKSSLVGYGGHQNLRSLDKANHSKIHDSPNFRINSATLDLRDNSQTHFNQTSPSVNVQYTTSMRENAHAVHNLINPPSSILNSLEKKCTFELKSGEASGTLDATDILVETAAYHINNSSLDHFSGVKQKWVPVGKKEPNKESPRMVTHSWGSILYKEHSKSIGKDVLRMANICPSGHSSSNLKAVLSASENNVVEHDFTERSVQLSGERSGENSVLSDDFSYKEKIVQAVADAYGVQTASEVIRLQTGYHLAEFEKVLHSVSPVIGPMSSLHRCRSCSLGRIIGNSFCRHQIPNISLGHLWQWYAKHGSYGLEVKVEDQHTKKLGSSSEFRAYFVPYLSAVQLFGQSKHRESAGCSYSDDVHRASEIDCPGDSSEMKGSLKCGSTLKVPILSILLPRPHQGMPAEVLDLCTGNDKCNVPADGAQDDGKLLFEYFESDPPQHRPPLFEKVKMLVRGERSLNSRIFGDPSKLECLHLHDIDPASWFSVAWYPIYRIPDGNLRSAFLTYHCLGNFAYRNSEAKHGNAADIVSPVVGLQSYNSKGECWFLLGDPKTNSFQANAPSLNPSEVLKERLKTLNQTAETMARASIQKHGQKSINRQPDYEFFVSRSW